MISDKNDPFATKIVVSLVKSPFYNANQVNLDRELKQYFNKTLKFKLHDRFKLCSFYKKGIPYFIYNLLNKE